MWDEGKGKGGHVTTRQKKGVYLGMFHHFQEYDSLQKMS